MNHKYTTIHKAVCLFLICVISNAQALEWREIVRAVWGDIFTTLNIDVGSYTMHINNPRGDYKNFYPTIDVNYLGIGVMYFKNTHGDHTYGGGIERYWKKWPLYKGNTYLGYRFGAVYGYCRNAWSFQGLYSRCHPRTGESFPPGHNPKQGLQPMGQLFLTYRQNGLGVMFATAIALSTISAVFYFD